MGSACGVSWDGTSGGKLDRSEIPDPPDHKSHFLNAAETKGDSSFPVVDGGGNLRAGNVASAWDLRNNGEGVSEECLRKLAAAFDENPLPESATENSRRSTVTLGRAENSDEPFGINVRFSAPPSETLGSDFNQHGVRVNDDGSVDVRFNAMEPGVRRDVEVTPSFLSNVAGHSYDRIPLQLDHSKSQMANVGFVEPQNIKFSRDPEFLQIQAHIPDTGNSVRQDVIADFTHEPPQITDISASFVRDSIEIEPPDERDGNPTFVDAKLREFSLTPFPAGYDNGGLTAAFSEAVDQAADCPCRYAEDEAESQIVKRPHYIIKNKHD